MRLPLFIGLFLIVGGLSIFADILFRIHLPFMRILFGLTLIYLGLSILSRGVNIRQPWLFSDPHSIIFQNTTLTPRADSPDSREINLLFSQGVVDLTSLVPKEHDIELKVNVVFGNALIRIDPRIPIKIIASAAFAGCRLPAGDPLVFGDRIYHSPGYDMRPAIVLRLSTVFAGADFLRSEGEPAAPACVGDDCSMRAANEAPANP